MWKKISRCLPQITYNSKLNDKVLRQLLIPSRFIYNNLNVTTRLHTTHASQKRLAEKINIEQDCNSFSYRTHSCGELRDVNAGQKVTLCGWIQYIRHSKFLLLRDAYGLTQCIVSNEFDISNMSLETVVLVRGTVICRPKPMINPQMATGEIEVDVEHIEILNSVNNLPFNLRNYQKPKEQLRLQHRYVDLRFPEMQNNLRQRSTMLHNMRRFLVETHGFVEVETPTLFCRTPGGAREFVVPTRHSGLFYSLVQSPQQFKQILMSGGIDRYFQVARCYRDETTRPDRQPEFTQLDVEMSFTNLNGVLSLIEQLLFETFPRVLPKPPFKRMTYKYAMENYGTDKPNLTYGLKFENLKNLFPDKLDDPTFGVYAIPYPKEIGKFTSKQKEQIRNIRKKYDTKVILHENITKELGPDLGNNIQGVVGLLNSTLIAMGENVNACLCLGEIRELIADVLQSKSIITIKKDIQILWVVDFPLFVKGEHGLETCHHPFTAPHPDDMHLLKKDPLKVRSLAYDIVMNGNEIGGGSVRIHNVELQKEILKMLKIDTATLSHFLNALSSGCPPHAGIALGIDRLISLACETESIRDVIAFPKSHDGKDPLSGAPSNISEEDQKYYHIATIKED